MRDDPFVSRGESPRQHTVESLLKIMMPPQLTSSAMHEIDQFVRGGIARNREAMNTYSQESGIAYQDVNRTAVQVALDRAKSNEVVSGMTEVYKRLVDKKKWVKAVRRDRVMKPIKSLMPAFQPILPIKFYHLWYYDEDNRKLWRGVLSGMGDAPVYVLDMFVSQALSEVPNLGEIENDLKEEFAEGMYQLTIVYGAMQAAEREFDKMLDAQK